MPSAPKQKTRHERRLDPTSTANGSSDPSSSGGSSHAGPSRHAPRPLDQRDEAGVPGLSKLKASIRQTKRLLAKDNLQPGLRIATQRRLTSLEADLAKAERRGLAKKNGGKYHMVKFFERQKLKRLVKKYKKKLADETRSASKRVKMEKELHEARVMLNYILHFPNEQKYISLFPPSPVQTSDENPIAEPKLDLPQLLHPATEPTEKSEKRRLEILRSVEAMMARGEVSSTPEEDGRGGAKKVDLKVGGGEHEKAQKSEEGRTDAVEADDFFEDGDE